MSTRRTTQAGGEESLPRDVSISIQRLSKRYRLGRGPATSPLEGTPPPAFDGDDPWSGRIDSPRATRPSSLWALRDLTLDVGRGTALAVVGPNGSGKTTLLKVLARITPPTSGRVVTRGRVAPLIELASAFLQPEQTGRKNVLLLAQVLGVPRRVAERAMGEIADFADIGPLLDVQAKRYSGGLYRRLALSVALNLDPDILVSDELPVGGDAHFRRRCVERFEEARRRGLTIVLASHDLEMLERFCDYAVRLEGGRLVDQGPADAVLARYAADTGRKVPVERPPPPRAEPGAASPPVKRRSFSPDAALVGGGIFAMDGFSVETLRLDEDAMVAVTLEAATAGTQIRCVVAFCIDGEQVVRVVQPRAFEVKKPGTYSATVHMPAGTLWPAFYTGRIGAWITHEGSETPIVKPDAFGFQVYDAEDLDEVADADSDPPQLAELEQLAWTVVEGRVA
jgi:ABC-type polysaccharide/polyol phosphate transport system ATPase subunit